MDTICLYCGRKFQKQKDNQMFCSFECRSRYLQKDKRASLNRFRSYIIVCKNCGKEFEYYALCDNRKYCSEKCRDEFNLKGAKTHIHGINQKFFSTVGFIVADLIDKVNNQGDIYNNKCLDYYNLETLPQRTRDAVLERDNYSCQICGDICNLHVHHKIKRVNGGNHDPSNLITLCPSCHRHIETGDLIHALESCQKNYLKNHGKTRTRTKSEVKIENAVEDLSNLYEKVRNNQYAKEEIMGIIANIIDVLS